MITSRRELLAFVAALVVSPRPGEAQPQPRRRAPTIDPLRRECGTCVMAGFSGLALPRTLATLLDHDALGGVFLLRPRRPGIASEHVRALTDDARLRGPRDAPALVAVDQEGGVVARLTPPMFRIPTARQLGTIGDPALTERVAAAAGASLAAMGVSLNFAPVLDVRTARNPLIAPRAFGTDPAVVARHGEAWIRGTQRSVAACGKHLPGHGPTRADSHAALPRVDLDRAHVMANELVPFRAAVAAGVDTLMLGHLVYRAFDARLPASLSPAIATDLVRRELGFRGVVVTDDLEMGAIRTVGGAVRATVSAIRAGVDLALVAHSPAVALRAIDALVAAASRDEALRRRVHESSERVRALRRTLATRMAGASPQPPDVSALERELRDRL
ncbi:MAG: beta-glucosidase family protein [Deltaproteobacteria bacterium]|nr:beta-glucosidase family protein [Deltaproteobacteria bacterium]